jgi:hypothetical protein
MPVVWRILYVLNHLVEDHSLDIRNFDLATLYNLRTHNSSRFVLQLIRKDVYPVLKATKNEDSWKNNFFFVRKESIPGGPDLPPRWPTKGRIRSLGQNIHKFILTNIMIFILQLCFLKSLPLRLILYREFKLSSHSCQG